MCFSGAAESLQSLQPSPTVQRYLVNRSLGDSKLPVGLKVVSLCEQCESTDDLSRVYPAFHPVSASHNPANDEQLWKINQ